MTEIKVSERKFEEVTVLNFEGDITIGQGTSILRQETRRLIKEGRINIILNLADVRYIDSSGLGEMVSALTASGREGGTIVLLNVSQNVRELLRVTKLVTVFRIYNDEQSAFRSIRGG